MIEKISVVAPTTAVPISTGLAVALNVLPAPSFSSRKSLAFFEIGVETEFVFDLSASVGLAGEGGEFEDRLGVVGHGAIRIDGDRDRPHPQEPERDEAEGKHGRGNHQLS